MIRQQARAYVIPFVFVLNCREQSVSRASNVQVQVEGVGEEEFGRGLGEGDNGGGIS